MATLVVKSPVSHEQVPKEVINADSEISKLHEVYFGFTPREAYAKLCRRYKQRCLDPVAVFFSDKIGDWSSTRYLDISKTYIGPNGLTPLTEMCKLLPKLTIVSLRNSYLQNNSLWFFSQMAISHPSIQQIDISQNWDLSWPGALSLLELATRNSNILQITLSDTSIPKEAVELIKNQLVINHEFYLRNRRIRERPSAHPLMTHMRAMKAFFEHHAVEGVVERTILPTAVEERMRIMGKLGFPHDVIAQEVAKLEKHCYSDTLVWEQFMILLMVPHALYHQGYVNKLQETFQHYAIGDKQEIVEVSKLPLMMQRLDLNDFLIKDKMQECMERFELDSQMTLRWDDFLLLMYFNHLDELKQLEEPVVTDAT